jgi:hypothetical protein
MPDAGCRLLDKNPVKPVHSVTIKSDRPSICNKNSARPWSSLGKSPSLVTYVLRTSKMQTPAARKKINQTESNQIKPAEKKITYKMNADENGVPREKARTGAKSEDGNEKKIKDCVLPTKIRVNQTKSDRSNL